MRIKGNVTVEPEVSERSADNPPKQPDSYKYAVVDLAAATSLRSAVLGKLRTVAEPLLARNAPIQVLEVGPWIVRLSKAEDIARALGTVGPDSPWGYYVYTSVDIVSLRQTLRRFNLVGLPGSPKPVLFRYWDPRVMRSFLEIASRSQRRSLFDFIDRVQALDGSFDAQATDGFAA